MFKFICEELRKNSDKKINGISHKSEKDKYLNQ